MVSVVLVSLFTLSRGDEAKKNLCNSLWNPVCCPDPEHYPHATDFRQYSNVCEFGYGKKPGNGGEEDAIECGYGACPPCLCPMDYDPTCCGGSEFPNPCMASCADANGCTGEPCEPPPCLCTPEFRPVCCPQYTPERQYVSPCEASCDGLGPPELVGCHYGNCTVPDPDGCMCQAIFEPVCCDGQDFANQCTALNCGDSTINPQSCERGVCQTCDCTLEHKPVCCPGQSNGEPQKTYGNSCAAECGRGVGELLDCYYGPCPTCPCPMNRDPVCCSGIEYGNACEAECANVQGGCTDGPCSYSANAGAEEEDDSDNDTDESEDESSEADIAFAFEENSAKKCLCQMDLSPVCCKYDDPYDEITEVTYGNRCEANCDFNAGECKKGECEESMCECTLQWKPVCCPRENGDPGEQFSNSCNANCAKSKEDLLDCHYGMCDDRCACPMIHDPVCCGGVEYGNACAADCANEDLSKCDNNECPTICPPIYDPQCCKGNQEYDNECLADEAGAEDCVSDTCEEPCICNWDYIPVCCGEITYGNKCAADCAGEDLLECDYGECEEMVCDCKEKEKPVCCSGEGKNKYSFPDFDEREYRNKCLAKCAGEKPKNCDEGRCDSDGGKKSKDKNKSKEKDKSAGMIVGVHGVENSIGSAHGPHLVGFNVNTIILGCILVSIVSFVCIYYKRTSAARFEKEQRIAYESDQ